MTAGRKPTIPALLQTYVGRPFLVLDQGLSVRAPHLISPLSLGAGVLERERDTQGECVRLYSTHTGHTLF